MNGIVRRVCRNVKLWRDAAMACAGQRLPCWRPPKGFRRLKAHRQLQILKSALVADGARHESLRISGVSGPSPGRSYFGRHFTRPDYRLSPDLRYPTPDTPDILMQSFLDFLDPWGQPARSRRTAGDARPPVRQQVRLRRQIDAAAKDLECLAEERATEIIPTAVRADSLSKPTPSCPDLIRASVISQYWVIFQ